MADRSQVRISLMLQSLARRLDKIFKREVGERVAWSLITWPQSGDQRANYVSNCPRDEVVKALKELLKRWEEGMPDVPAHKVQ